MEGALNTTAFRGLRRVSERQNGVLLEQLEDVGADGSGQFAIELDEVITLPPDIDQWSYDVVFENSARFLWTMRDFQVHDASRAADSYLIQLLAETPTVAGISCVRLSFLRDKELGGRPGHYLVDVDPNTGFVLGWRELDEDGLSLVEVAYETFAYGGDLSDLTLRGRSFSATALSLALPISGQVTFPVRFPDSLPGSMELVAAEVMDVPVAAAATLSPGATSFLPVGNWLRLVGTDGIESVVFAHSGLTQAGPTAQLGELRMVKQGAWEVGFGVIDGTKFVAAGRLTMDELEWFVSSAF